MKDGPAVFIDAAGVWQARYRDKDDNLKGFKIPDAESGEQARQALVDRLRVPAEAIEIQDQ